MRDPKLTPSEIMNRPAWGRNFRSALAAFIQEEMPVNDHDSDWANDMAWSITRDIEDRFLSAFYKIQEPIP